MRWSKFARDFTVIFGSSVFVPNKNCDRRPECSAFKNAGQKFAPVFLFALGRQFALTRATTIQLSLNFRFGNFDAWRATIDHHADAAAMGLAKCGDAKEMAERVTHCHYCSTGILTVGPAGVSPAELRYGTRGPACPTARDGRATALRSCDPEPMQW